MRKWESKGTVEVKFDWSRIGGIHVHFVGGSFVVVCDDLFPNIALNSVFLLVSSEDPIREIGKESGKRSAANSRNVEAHLKVREFRNGDVPMCRF
jgi:hypothetical protein